jgi:transposase
MERELSVYVSLTTLTTQGIMVHKKLYTKEFKQEAVRLAQQSGNKAQVVRDLSIHTSMLRRWEQEFREYGEQASPGKGHV